MKKSEVDVFFIFLAIAAGLFLKYIYTLSDTNSLLFILWPTSKITELLTGANATYDVSGFYYPTLNIIIDKSCSGFNFWIISFCALVSIIISRHYITKNKALLFAALFILSYVLTILANVSRIVISIKTIQFENIIPWLKYSWIHETEGALVYLILLVAFSLFTKFLSGKIIQNAKST